MQSYRAPFRAKFESDRKLLIPHEFRDHLRMAQPVRYAFDSTPYMPDATQAPAVRRFGAFDARITHHGPGSLELLATAHARAGHRAEALRLLDELKKGQQAGQVQATSFINPNLALANYDEAFVWFERAYQQREGILRWLRVHPFFDPVREDPRFKDLVRRVGLN